ncbi:MAG: hypothetical protein OEW70_05775 [candidate division WOR-3 bacterium]|nr:hypothetical protein [candidate division WOR-3 bacterium]
MSRVVSTTKTRKTRNIVNRLMVTKLVSVFGNVKRKTLDETSFITD